MLKIFRFLKPYKIPVVIVVALTFLQTLSELYLPTLMSDIVDIGIVRGNINYIVKIGGFMLLVTLGGGICGIMARLFGGANFHGVWQVAPR